MIMAGNVGGPNVAVPLKDFWSGLIISEPPFICIVAEEVAICPKPVGAVKIIHMDKIMVGVFIVSLFGEYYIPNLAVI